MAARESLKRGLRYASKWVFAAGDVPFRTRPGPRILIYHQVGARMGRQMEVTPEAFEAQLRWLVGHGTVVTLDDALARADEEGSDRLFVLTFDDGYRDIYETARPLLDQLDLPYLIYVTTGPVESGHGSDPSGRDAPLSWDQIAEMAEGGATIGSHTHNHPDLRTLSSAEVLRELEESDDLIRRRVGIDPEHFCYPYGYWSSTAHPIVTSRYRTATLGGGAPVSGTTDPHLINRVPVQLSDTSFFFTRKMTSGMRLEEAVRRRLSGYEGP